MRTADTEHYVVRTTDWRKAKPNGFVLVYHRDTQAPLELGIVSSDHTWIAYRGRSYRVARPFRTGAIFAALEC